jgi:hypothetical protein
MFGVPQEQLFCGIMFRVSCSQSLDFGIYNYNASVDCFFEVE